MIWRRASAQQSVLSLLPPPPLLLKKEETFYYRNISGEGIILKYSFTLIQKNQRRVKLQSLQFYISVIIFEKMVVHVVCLHTSNVRYDA